MGNIIDGKALSQVVKDEVKAEVLELEAKYGRKPCLVVIIVGENPASQVYVRNKVKAAAYTGMDSRLVELPADISEEALLGQIRDLNEDPSVDGILVQLPLPKHIDEEKVIDTIAREKDVDGFHPGNVAGLWIGKDCIVPCTPAGIMRLIDSVGTELKGKQAVVVGRSNIVGKPVAKLLLDRHATVTIAHSRTADLAAITRQADIIVAALGIPRFLKGEQVKEGVVVIDVGINRIPDPTAKNGCRLVGDVDFDSVAQKASLITPVPGGVGPMTIAMLMKNTLRACRAAIGA